MIEIDPAARIGVYGYGELKNYIASLFDGRVDVVDGERLMPHVRLPATSDAIYAFKLEGTRGELIRMRH